MGRTKRFSTGEKACPKMAAILINCPLSVLVIQLHGIVAVVVVVVVMVMVWWVISFDIWVVRTIKCEWT